MSAAAGLTAPRDALAHQSHRDIANRLKRATGHLQTIIGMVESGRDCVEVAQQMHAVIRAVEKARKEAEKLEASNASDDNGDEDDASAESSDKLKKKRLPSLQPAFDDIITGIESGLEHGDFGVLQLAYAFEKATEFWRQRPAVAE